MLGFDLEGRVAIVTGASSGIGLGIAHGLVEYLAQVVILDLNCPFDMETEFGELSNRVTYFKGDVSEESKIDAVLDTVLSRFGKVDILVNNAGIANVNPIGAIDFKNWTRLMDINLKGAALCANKIVPHMKAARWGRIINISSVAGIMGFQTYSAYGASKAALKQLSRIWSSELAPHNITVNSILPGWVKTPLLPTFIKRLADIHNISIENSLSKVLSFVPQHRFINISEIAFCVLFLCSSLAQGITGAELIIDAGLTTSRFPPGFFGDDTGTMDLDYVEIRKEIFNLVDK